MEEIMYGFISSIIKAATGLLWYFLLNAILATIKLHLMLPCFARFRGNFKNRAENSNYPLKN